MGFQSDSSYHLQSEQTAFNRQTGKHILNSACICHSQILNNEVISEWKGNIEKKLSIEYGFPSGTRLMGILRIHLKIYLPECIKWHENTCIVGYPGLPIQIRKTPYTCIVCQLLPPDDTLLSTLQLIINSFILSTQNHEGKGLDE